MLEGLNNKAKVVWHRAYGYNRSSHMYITVPYHYYATLAPTYVTILFLIADETALLSNAVNCTPRNTQLLGSFANMAIA